jgi:hypothetical protein
MFDRLNRAAKQTAEGVDVSRRGFLGRLARVAGGTAVGLTAFFMARPACAGGQKKHTICYTDPATGAVARCGDFPTACSAAGISDPNTCYNRCANDQGCL